LRRENGRIAYDDAGSGPLVVCIPSIGDVRAEYRFLAEQLIQLMIFGMEREAQAARRDGSGR